MSQYNITRACGHSETIQISGPWKDRDWKVKSEERKLCSDCWKAEQSKVRADAISTAVEFSKANNLPGLKGSEKQIAWAEQIRKEHFDLIDPWAEKGITQDIKDAFRRVVDEYMAETSAHAWIERRHTPPSAKWLGDCVQKQALMDADLARMIRTALVAAKLNRASS